VLNEALVVGLQERAHRSSGAPGSVGGLPGRRSCCSRLPARGAEVAYLKP
jgi:hypothetical protein